MAMREIKFRAWDGNEMHSDVVTIDYRKPQTVGDIELGHSYSPRFTTVHMEEVMQYTGLLDKNGVEIYEGDIVKVRALDDQVVSSLAYDGCEVIFHKGSFRLKDCYYLYLFEVDHEHDAKLRIEVIGNIYENKELLEQ